jgi:hypothetical protein
MRVEQGAKEQPGEHLRGYTRRRQASGANGGRYAPVHVPARWYRELE